MQIKNEMQVAMSPSEFEITFSDPAGAEQRVPLDQAARIPFEVVTPVRSFPSFKGQRNNTGWWWTATTSTHVGFESWLERDLLVGFDFDPTVVGISSQPFWLLWQDEGRTRRHAPDFFLRYLCGRAAVMDCRPADRIKPRDAAAFTGTAHACAQVGWSFELLHSPDPVRTANLRWLAGYRHPRCGPKDPARITAAVTAAPMPVMEMACLLGDPVGTLPTVFHLLWHGLLETNLSVTLTENSLVSIGSMPLDTVPSLSRGVRREIAKEQGGDDESRPAAG